MAADPSADLAAAAADFVTVTPNAMPIMEEGDNDHRLTLFITSSR